MTVMASTRNLVAMMSMAAAVGTLTVAVIGQAPGAGQAPAAPVGQAGGQGRGGRGQPQPPQTPQAQAPIDLTGWWVSVVTEDWRWRMVTPPKGDYASVPISNDGRRLADTWDPAKDEREGNACRSYGAAAIMRVPGRVHITWQDERTLKLETDAGTQTRVLQFESADGTSPPAPSGDATWQGHSVASWEMVGVNRGGGAGGGGGGGGGAGGAGGGGGAGGRAGGPPPPRYGSLKVVTTKMKAGYLRKNGVPYSETAGLTEYFDRHVEQNCDQWFTVTTIVEDSKNLTQPFITTSHFKKEPDGSKWRPTACTAQ